MQISPQMHPLVGLNAHTYLIYALFAHAIIFKVIVSRLASKPFYCTIAQSRRAVSVGHGVALSLHLCMHMHSKTLSLTHYHHR